MLIKCDKSRDFLPATMDLSPLRLSLKYGIYFYLFIYIFCEGDTVSYQN